MRASLKTLISAALVFGGAAIFQPSDASAQPYPRFRPAVGAHFGPRPAFRPVGYRRAAFYGHRRGFYGPRYGYRPYYGYRRYGYPYGYYRRGYGYGGGAIAAGLIGGLALGSIASAAANPYYYGWPGYYRPAYYSYGGNCVVERRRIVNRYGRVAIQRIETCY